MRVVCSLRRRRPVVGRSGVAGGALPAEFKSADEALFDFGGHVAVGLDQPIRQVMAQPPGLRDFGNTVGNEPGFMAMAQAVEGEPRPNRPVPFFGSPSTAGRNTRRSKSLRRSGYPCGLVNTKSPAETDMCIWSKPARNRGNVMVRADAGVFGGPNQSRCVDSCNAPVSGLIVMVRRRRST
jgi:hypothetical protein